MSNYNYIISHNNINKLPSPLIQLDKGDINNNYSLILFGSASTEYAQLFQENTLRLLENFARSVPPRAPTEGQTWYDKTSRTLFVATVQTPYSENNPEVIEWKYINAPIISSTEPIGRKVLWHNPIQGETYAFNGEAYEPLGLHYLDGSGGTISGTVTTEYPIVGNTWTNTSVVTFNNNDINVTNLKIENTSIKQQHYGDPLAFTDNNLIVTYPSVTFEVSNNHNVNITHNENAHTPIIEFTSLTHIYKPLNINNVQMTVGVDNASTTSALTKSEMDGVLQLITTPGNYLPTDGSQPVVGKILTSHDFCISTNTSSSAVIMEVTNRNSISSETSFVNSNSSGGTAGGITSSLRVNGEPFLQYDSDTPSVIQLRTNARIYNTMSPEASTDIANNEYFFDELETVSTIDSTYRTWRAIAWCTFQPDDSILNSFGVSEVKRINRYYYRVTFNAEAEQHIDQNDRTMLIIVSPLTHREFGDDTWQSGSEKMCVLEARAFFDNRELNIVINETQNRYLTSGSASYEQIFRPTNTQYITDYPISFVIYDTSPTS